MVRLKCHNCQKCVHTTVTLLLYSLIILHNDTGVHGGSRGENIRFHCHAYVPIVLFYQYSLIRVFFFLIIMQCKEVVVKRCDSKASSTYYRADNWKAFEKGKAPKGKAKGKPKNQKRKRRSKSRNLPFESSVLLRNTVKLYTNVHGTKWLAIFTLR